MISVPDVLLNGQVVKFIGGTWTQGYMEPHSFSAQLAFQDLRYIGYTVDQLKGLPIVINWRIPKTPGFPQYDDYIRFNGWINQITVTDGMISFTAEDGMSYFKNVYSDGSYSTSLSGTGALQALLTKNRATTKVGPGSIYDYPDYYVPSAEIFTAGANLMTSIIPQLKDAIARMFQFKQGYNPGIWDTSYVGMSPVDSQYYGQGDTYFNFAPRPSENQGDPLGSYLVGDPISVAWSTPEEAPASEIIYFADWAQQLSRVVYEQYCAKKGVSIKNCPAGQVRQKPGRTITWYDSHPNARVVYTDLSINTELWGFRRIVVNESGYNTFDSQQTLLNRAYRILKASGIPKGDLIMRSDHPSMFYRLAPGQVYTWGDPLTGVPNNPNYFYSATFQVMRLEFDFASGIISASGPCIVEAI